MFGVRYRNPECRDCGEPNHRPVCRCGYMRPLDDEFRIVPLAWSTSGSGTRSQEPPPWLLCEMRDRIIAMEYGPLDGDGFGDGWGYGFGDGDGFGGGW